MHLTGTLFQTLDLNACKKGCRLMTIIDFMEDQATFDELLSDCRKSEI